MNILTWNIQATKGCDGRFDYDRIVQQISAFGDLDVICLQEISRNIPNQNDDDQVTLISDHFAEFDATWASGFSVPNSKGSRSEFGNLTLVKRPLLKNSRTHILASPVVGELQMPRTMAEVVVNANGFELAIFNTHLAFHSANEQIAQLQDLTQLRDQIINKSTRPKRSDETGPYSYTGSVQAVLLCGDLNIDSDSIEFKTHITDQNWLDCWNMQTKNNTTDPSKREPTCGCFDRAQWPQGPHVRDYFLATENIAVKTLSVSVNVETDASDHQPVLLEIDL